MFPRSKWSFFSRKIILTCKHLTGASFLLPLAPNRCILDTSTINDICRRWCAIGYSHLRAFLPTSCGTSPPTCFGGRSNHPPQGERDIDNLLVRTHFIIEMISWTGLAPGEFEFTFPGSLASTLLATFQGTSLRSSSGGRSNQPERGRERERVGEREARERERGERETTGY